MMAEVLVILPTYNERDSIPSLVEGIFAHSPSAHVVIVDDGSPDGTGDVADTLAGADKRTHVIHRPGKLGLGSAWAAGFRYGLTRSYEYFVQMDADLSHDPSDLPRLLARAQKGTDFVIGSRLTPGSRTEKRKLHRRALSHIGNAYARSLLNVPAYDLTTGYRCLRRKTLEMLNLDALQASGYLFLIETAYLLSRQGCSIEEVPILFVDRKFGKSKFVATEAAKTIGFVWRLRRMQRVMPAKAGIQS